MFDRIRRSTNSDSDIPADCTSQSQQNLNSNVGEETTNMSYDLKIYCFIGCFILSFLCSILGSPLLIAGKLTGFAVMVSLGSILSICGTFFLCGPLNQLKKMFDRTRLIATLVYLLMIVLTLVAGLVLKSPVIAVVCIIGQYISMAWYSLSFVPYVREMISGCVSKLWG